MIAVANLYKKIGDVQALDNLSLEAADGQITGLLGPNGPAKPPVYELFLVFSKPMRAALLSTDSMLPSSR